MMVGVFVYLKREETCQGIQRTIKGCVKHVSFFDPFPCVVIDISSPL
jgi:hypothetical protein